MWRSPKSRFKLPKLPGDTFFVLISLGVHAFLLGSVLPKLTPVFVGEVKYQQEDVVPVIELNPLEQSRLPPSSSLVEPVPSLPTTEGDLSKELPTPEVPPFVPSLPPPPPPPAPRIVFAPPPLTSVTPKLPAITPIPKTEVIPPATVNTPPEAIQPTPTTIVEPKIKTDEETKIIVAKRQKSLLDSVTEKAKLLRLDTTNTTYEEAETNYKDWLGKIQAESAADAEIAAPYPKDACIKKLQGTAVYGVLVNTEGKATESQLIRSSGYGIFNQEAEELINKATFDNVTGEIKPYQVSVKFELDKKVCPSLSVGDLPTPTPSP